MDESHGGETYRTDEEIEAWKQNDSIAAFRASVAAGDSYLLCFCSFFFRKTGSFSIFRAFGAFCFGSLFCGF